MNEIIKKNGITFGVISGVISILITTGIYVIDINLFVSWWVTTVALLVPFVLAIVLLSKTKKELQGNLSFKDAFTTYFIMALIGVLMSAAFNILLFNFIDPSLKETIKELTLKISAEMMQKFGAPTSDINKALKTINETDQFSVGAQLQGILSSIVVTSIFGLVLAAFFKTPTRQEY